MTHVSALLTKNPPLVIGHRGACAHRPENTLSSFQAAVQAGSGMIEMDVRLSLDHHPVVFHDSRLRRLYGTRHRISGMTYAEISRRTDGQVPLLRDVLEIFRGKVLFYVEIKAERLPAAARALLVRKVWEDIKATGTAQDCLIASFDYRVCGQYRRLCPRGWTGFIFANRRSLRSPRKAGFQDADVLCPHKKLLTARFACSARILGKQVYVWVMDKAREWNRARTLGVNGIVTNDPAMLLRYL